jgi:hypothetical protein
MHDPVLYCFSARRKLTDCDVKVTVYSVIRWPFPSTIRIVMEEIPHAGRETKHWKETSVREQFA